MNEKPGRGETQQPGGEPDAPKVLEALPVNYSVWFVFILRLVFLFDIHISHVSFPHMHLLLQVPVIFPLLKVVVE